jgi:hypothetical protein
MSAQIIQIKPYQDRKAQPKPDPYRIIQIKPYQDRKAQPKPDPYRIMMDTITAHWISFLMELGAAKDEPHSK